MDHDRNTESLPRFAGQLGAMGAGGGGQSGPADVGEGNAGLLEYRALGQDAGPASAAFRTAPVVLPKPGRSILRFQPMADRILQRAKGAADPSGVVGSAGHSPALGIVNLMVGVPLAGGVAGDGAAGKRVGRWITAVSKPFSISRATFRSRVF